MKDDGTYVDIGTAISSGYYGTFGLSWTPTEQGTYEIVASFAGDDSYGSSGASTFVTVGPASSASEPLEPETPEEPAAEPSEAPLISTELAIVLAVVAACIIGAVAYFVLRKRG
jgi:hypothetical protein